MADRFLFFQNFKQTADTLPDDLRLKFYDAICEYVFEGSLPDEPVICALITAIKPSLDKKYNFGGAPKGNQNARKTGDKTIKTTVVLNKQPQTTQNNQNKVFKETGSRKRKEETETEDNSVYSKIKDFLIDRLSEIHNRSFTGRGWVEEIRKLCELDKVPPDRVMNALRWHFDNYDREFRLEIQSAKALREKFSRLEAQKARADAQNNEPFRL